MTVTRIHEDPRVTRALYRSAVGGDRCAGRTGRRRPGEARRAPHAGRRADVRVDRRHGWRGMEHRGARRQEARARRSAVAATEDPFRQGRLRARRAGQVVPGRSPAALGGRRLLARRRRAAVARRRADRRHARQRQYDHRRGARLHVAAGGATRPAAATGADRVRRRSAAAQGRDRAAGESWIRSRPTCRCPASGRGSRGCCSPGSTSPAGFVLPLKAARAEGRGGAWARAHGNRARGRSNASDCTRSRATRRSACACRCRRCPMCCPRTPSTTIPSIRSRPAARCRRTTR